MPCLVCPVCCTLYRGAFCVHKQRYGWLTRQSRLLIVTATSGRLHAHENAGFKR